MFESVNSVSRYDMVRQTVPYGYYPVSEVEFSQVIVTVVLNQFIFITFPRQPGRENWLNCQ